MHKIAVIDDDSLFLDKMRNILEKYDNFEPYFYNNPIDFLTNHSIYQFSLIFLDIEMPNLNGLEVINKLQEMGHETLVIFITNDDQYMINCFNKNVISFVSKTNLNDTIHIHIKKAITLLTPKTYSFQTEFGSKTVAEADITSITIELRRMILIINNNYQIVLQYKTLIEVQEILNSNLFFQINRSTIVNLSRITKYTNNDIYLSNFSTPLQLSKYRKKEFIDAYFEYSLRRKTL